MTVIDQEALRTAIKIYAKNLGITQSELGDLAKVCQPQISRFITGTSKFSLETSERVSKALSRIVGDRVAAIGLPLTSVQENSKAELRA